MGLLLRKLFAKRVIFDIHEDYPKSMLSKSYMPKLLRKCMAYTIDFCQKLFSKEFDYMIAAGEDIADNFRDSGYNKIIVLNNVPPKEFVEACAKKTEMRGNRIVYAGGLSRIQG